MISHGHPDQVDWGREDRGSPVWAGMSSVCLTEFTVVGNRRYTTKEAGCIVVHDCAAGKPTNKGCISGCRLVCLSHTVTPPRWFGVW